MVRITNSERTACLFFECRCVPDDTLHPRCRRCPTYCIGNHALHLFVMVGGYRLVSWTKIKDLALTTRIATPTTEDLTTTKPTHEDQCFRCRYIKMLTIHLFVFQINILTQPFSNPMPWRNHPETLMIIGLAPLQIARRTHQAFKNLGEVSRM